MAQEKKPITTIKGKTTPKKRAPKKEAVAASAKPHSHDLFTGVASTRRNKAATQLRTDQYKNIDDAPYPFKEKRRRGSGANSISIQDTVELTQKAYFNFPVLKNVVDVMTEFSSGKIHLKGGNEKSRKFFDSYFKKINMWNLIDQFFREYYRSGNVFLYKLETKVNKTDVRRMENMFGAKAKSSPLLPTRYVLLNPADIEASGASNFVHTSYFKILNDYEIDRLKNSGDEKDREVFESLPEEIKEQINEFKGKSFMGSEFQIPLDIGKLSAVFYKKQDYEPFGVPMGWPVLKDLSAKEEMKQIDMAIARIMQQCLLLVTAGAEPDKGGINAAHMDALNDLFKNQSVGRVLVADYTTEAKFVIPDIADVLTPEKYEILDNDINIGLNNIFTGGEKFANQSAKVEVFIERLKHGREAFLNEFLVPQMQQISGELGFRSWPTPSFEELDLKDKGVMAKLYVEMAKIGLLTPEETFKAVKTNELPDDDTSYEDQVLHKDRKDKGYYSPPVGAGAGGKEGAGLSSGRPPGGGTPKTTNTTPSPMGAGYGVKLIRENFIKASVLEEAVAKAYKKSNNLRKLKPADEVLIDQITKTVIANCEPDTWLDSVGKYLETPMDDNHERINKIMEVQQEHKVDFFMASMLLASVK